ncbi:MAG: FAD-binding oxidoreductase [Granulosicoccus sp.]
MARDSLTQGTHNNVIKANWGKRTDERQAHTAVTISSMSEDHELLEKLVRLVGAAHVLRGEDVSARSTHFWDPSPLEAMAIIRPANTAETAEVIKACHAAGQAVITHGGVTGLVDGNRTHAGDIVLSLERQRSIESVDAIGRTMTLQAGAILQDVQQAANDAGLQFGLDLGARGSCTIGGNLSTNAGGLSVLRYGMAREQVLGLEVVLADGTVMSSMNHMLKNNAGYDLKHLFIGSEGTLGIITRVVLRLRAQTPAVNTALLAFDSFTNLTSTLALLDRQFSGTLDAFEVLWQPFYKLNTTPGLPGSVAAPLPDDYPLYAIVETKCASSETGDAQFEATLEMVFEKGYLADAIIAKSRQERASIWHIRENIELALKHDPVFVYDISLPVASMERYVSDLEQNLRRQWPDVILYVYGHLADGNLHILVAPPAGSELSGKDKRNWQSSSNAMVYEPLQQLGGSISAEHGIGLFKKGYLGLSRTPQEIQMMKLLKKTLDPSGILNPGKVVTP